MYYPKSQIKTDQITYGGELQNATTKEEYKGFYWVTSKGDIFSGKNPNDKPSDRLEKYLNSPIDITTGKELYEPFPESYFIKEESYYNGKKKRAAKKAPRNPKVTRSIPTEENYKKGKYTKYYVSKTNEIKFLEVSKTEYLKFKNRSGEVNWSLYEAIELEWVIGGDRETAFLTNKTSVHLLNDKHPGFESLFRNRYDRFWRSK